SSARPWRNSVPRRPAHTSNIPTFTTGGNYARRSPHVEVNSSRFSSETCPTHRWTSTTPLCVRLCADTPASWLGGSGGHRSEFSLFSWGASMLQGFLTFVVGLVGVPTQPGCST